ncbi:MAG: alpha/beta hydrolase [Opitutales bacterium]
MWRSSVSRALLAVGLLVVLTAGPATAAGYDQPWDRFAVSVDVDQPAAARLVGTVLIPHSRGPHPVVVIVAGSGPTDADGNSALVPGRNDSLKLLAEGLARAGIASLRFDKRGVGRSAQAGIPEESLRFDTYVGDVRAWLEDLTRVRRFSRIYLAGHSEGALVALSAAQGFDLSGLITVAGPGRPADVLMREQLKRHLPADSPLEEDAVAILDRLAAGEPVEEVPEPLQGVFRRSVQPYLMSMFDVQPQELVASVNTPVLIVQGTADLQVTPDDAENLAAARPDASVRLLSGMNHLLKPAELGPLQGQWHTYVDPSVPLASGLVEAVVGFVHDTAGAVTDRPPAVLSARGTSGGARSAPGAG